jgi:preprotein translocase subunit SecG
MLLTLGVSPWIASVLIALFLLVCVLMILVILIQRPQGGGLSGAFGSGSGGSGQTAFGTKTGDALTFATITIFVTYLALAVGLQFASKPGDAEVRPTAVESDGTLPLEQPAAPGPDGAIPDGSGDAAPINDGALPPTEPPATDTPVEGSVEDPKQPTSDDGQ